MAFKPGKGPSAIARLVVVTERAMDQFSAVKKNCGFAFPVFGPQENTLDISIVEGLCIFFRFRSRENDCCCGVLTISFGL